MRTLAIAAASLLSVGSASAADLPVKAAPMVAPAVYDWSGLFIGAQVGRVWGTVPNAFVIGGASTSQPAYATRGWVFGGHLGYNWQRGNVVFGVVADLEWSNVKGDDNGLSGVLDALESDWRGSLRGRLGLAWNQLLIYVTGGLAWANQEYFLRQVGGPGSTSVSITDLGWTLGVGGEYAINPAWSVFVEYRYTDFGSRSAIFAATAFSAAQTINYSYRDSATRIGISYHFGRR
jgi:outer membrane immunogenic protein